VGRWSRSVTGGQDEWTPPSGTESGLQPPSAFFDPALGRRVKIAERGYCCWRMSVFNPLEADEPIGVIALSGPVDMDRLETGLEVLRSWGHPVELASNICHRSGYLSGMDDARLEGLVELLDRGVRTLIAARGGYGATRLLRRLPWQRLVSEGVRIVGFSDLPAVLNPLARTAVQVHGPMVAAGLDRATNARRLRRLLAGELVGTELFRIPVEKVVRPGRARGVTAGGNLSLLAALMGTPWEVDLSDKVLFVEEVSEPPYRLDRLLTHLRCSVSFERVKALISGKLHACRPSSECASRWYDLLLESAPPGVPVIRDLPFGHGATNTAFPIGATVTIDTERRTIIWSE